MSTLASSILGGLNAGANLTQQAIMAAMRMRGMQLDEAYRASQLGLSQDRLGLERERLDFYKTDQQRKLDQQEADRQFLINQVIGQPITADSMQYGPYQPGMEPQQPLGVDDITKYAGQMSLNMLRQAVSERKQSLANQAIKAADEEQRRKIGSAVLEAVAKGDLDRANATKLLIRYAPEYVHGMGDGAEAQAMTGPDPAILQNMVEQGQLDQRQAALLWADTAGFDVPATLYNQPSQGDAYHEQNAPLIRMLDHKISSLDDQIRSLREQDPFGTNRDIHDQIAGLQMQKADLEQQQADIFNKEHEIRQQTYEPFSPRNETQAQAIDAYGPQKAAQGGQWSNSARFYLSQMPETERNDLFTKAISMIMTEHPDWNPKNDEDWKRMVEMAQPIVEEMVLRHRGIGGN